MQILSYEQYALSEIKKNQFQAMETQTNIIFLTQKIL